MSNVFATATRTKLRFASAKGNLTVEDLWDLPMDSTKGVSLNSLYIDVNKQLDAEKGVGLVSKPSKSSAVLAIKAEVIKEIFAVKQVEAEKAKVDAAKKVERQKLLNALDTAEANELGSKSAAEIRAKLEALDA